MPRKPRLEYPGAIYHVLNRGDQRDDIFKGDVGKVAIARRLRQESVMSLKWIANRLESLEMGSWTYVSNLLNQGHGSNPGSETLGVLFK